MHESRRTMRSARQPGDGFSRTAILAALAATPSLSRIEIARQTGIGAATVSGQVRRLARLGYVRELAPRSSGSGRPRVPLELVRDAAYVIGVALAHDHMILAAIRLDGEIVMQRRSNFDPAGEPIEPIATLVEDMISRMHGSSSCIAVGLSLSGVVDSDSGRVTVSVVMNWRNRDLGSPLERRLGLRVYVENDVHALATRELAFDSMGSSDNFALLVIGSGVGMAIVTEHAVFRVGQSSTEFGHVSIDPTGRLCRCGNSGCLQTYAGLGEIMHDISRASDTTVRSAQEIRERAESGDAPVLDHLGSIGGMLGRAVGGVATLLGLDTILITGESTQLWPYLAESFRVSLADTTQTLPHPARLVIREWAEVEGAAGAAGLALSRSLDAMA